MQAVIHVQSAAKSARRLHAALLFEIVGNISFQDQGGHRTVTPEKKDILFQMDEDPSSQTS